jgi:hypothetical protein
MAVAPALQAEAIQLRFKAQPGAVRFRVTGDDQVIHEGGAPGRTERNYQLTEVFERIRTGMGGDQLVALSTTLEKSLAVDGQPVDNLKFATDARLERFDSRGRRQDARDHSPGENLGVVFPEEAIEPGHTWQDELPSGPGFPLPVTVKRKFLGVRRVQGQRAALVRSKASVEGDLPDGGAVTFQMDSELALGLDDGELVRVRTDARSVMRRATPTPGGVTTIRRRSRRVLERTPAR